MTVDISEWDSEDWDKQIPCMEEWLRRNVGDLDDVWPDRRETLWFENMEQAIWFVMRWAS